MLESVIYAENTFVAVGDEGTIITSIDGILWTSSTSSTSANLKEVTYGNTGHFEVVEIIYDKKQIHL